ncbi:hypothetical protein NVP1029O_35 [Vibrio phage 1.029.O._10N.261.55.A7]|nr:hypothetical protein NVP1029O_35 [Vibrio phage 1.029.O._10N.261.55.A7]
MISTIFSKSNPSVGGVTFDCVFSESMEASYESTDYSVESGAVYQDHIRKLPKMITMRVASSDTPFAGPLGSLLATGAGYIGSKLPPLITGVAGSAISMYNASNASASPDTRSAAAWQEMLDSADKMNTFDVVTTKGIYQNYHIKKLYYECNPDNENSIEIIIDMKEIRQFRSGIESGQPSKSQLREGSSESIQASPPANLGGTALEPI